MHTGIDQRATGRLLVPSVALFLLCGCEEGSPTDPNGADGGDGPPDGSIRVTTVTTGSMLDPDGYVLTVDNGGRKSIGVNAMTTFANLTPGEHEVQLSGLTSNCEVSGANPLTVTVLAGEAVSTTFAVECEFVPVSAADAEIAFTTNRGGTVEIYLMAADGANPVNFTRDPANADVEPAWSPDGTRVAFVKGPVFEAASLYVMDADGLNLRGLGPSSAGTPAWSPEGTTIAFASGDIWVISADGSNLVNLTEHPAPEFEPTWSPDGTRIAFTRHVDGNDEIYVMGADGSNPVNLTNHSAHDLEPAWSPDGTKIAFARGPDFDAKDVYVMDADGSNPVNLTNQPGDDGWPTWSPDGTKIAFSTRRDGHLEVYIMDADGSDPVNLTNHRGFDGHPSWRPSR